jgi:hypothetical protein
MIRGIFAWLTKAVKAKKIEAYDIEVAPVKGNGYYYTPEGETSNRASSDMAKSYCAISCSNELTQVIRICGYEFIAHNIDTHRFVLAKHDSGAVHIFKVNNPCKGVSIEVNQFHKSSNFKLSNTALVARIDDDTVEITDKSTYEYYTKLLDPATIGEAA